MKLSTALLTDNDDPNTRGISILPSRERRESPIVVDDRTLQKIQFNVMPDRQVIETLYPTEYRVWDRYVEAEFSREYVSGMLHSPSHLIFLTALIQLQRIVYLYMCYELSLPYEPEGPELLKIWPTDVNVEMPKMLTATNALVHRLTMTEVKRLSHNRFFARSVSEISGVVAIQASAMIYRI